ncbi:hypothetical protein Acsp04_54820 [Actinomadura sp. NBRC 104425]|uniref:DUF5709 domain-containing protein n=1 Tax=Actinomadura sp. NBRC 104425 TaxID=3032204 RepID=UPI00249FD248|nr:DUF5709 domain-containing protein [Actinomadura sp. NBRC 104425]GLZ15247.1 hypothetical protein Acsp04_54820 [Actinomadura sp. NBRC 104425]
MTENDPGGDPERRYTSGPEDQGIPDLQDGTPGQQRAQDPQEAPLPGDSPMALDEYGTTEEEMHEGEPLDIRLAREEPDVTEFPDEPYRPAGRLVEEDEGAHTDTEKDAVARDVGDDGGGYSAEERAMRIEDE